MSKVKQSGKIIKFGDLMDSVWDFTIKSLDPFQLNFIRQYEPDFQNWNSSDDYHDVYIYVGTDEEISLGNLIKDKIASRLSVFTGFDLSLIRVNFGYYTHSSQIDYEKSCSDESHLMCPNCGSIYLHHTMQEDSVSFWCECCNANPELNIKHQKGLTVVYWEYFKTILK